MASRSLGTLTLDIVAKIGGFEQGLDRAARTSARRTREIERDAKERAKEIEKAFSGIGAAIAGGIAGISLGGVITKFITETKAAEQEQAQLAAVVKSTGMAAGYSVEQLNDMAVALAKSSVFSEGDLNKAQTRLLSYTGVVGETVPKAMQAVIDMSARLGMDLNQSAETIGKALDVPSEGLSALSKQGFRFTEDQKKVVEQLERTGKTAEAQKIILDALESSYGGAAAAARDTFGGALMALQNNIDDLLTGDAGSMKELKASVEALNSTLSADETKTAFQTLTRWITDVSVAAIEGAANLITFINSKNKMASIMGTDEFGKMSANAEAYSHQLGELTARAERYQEAISRGDSVDQNQRNLDRTRAKIDDVRRLAFETSAALKGFADTTSPLPAPAIADGQTGGRGGGGGSRGGKKAKADKETDFEKTMEQLRKQLDKTRELTTHEQLLSDIQAGRIKALLPGQQAILEGKAKEVDLSKANAKVVDESKKMEEEMQKFLGGMAADQTKKALDQIHTLKEQNTQMRDEVALIGLSAEARAALDKAKLSSLIATKEETLASRELYGASQSELEALRVQIDLLRERAGILTDKGIAEARAEDMKFAEQMEKNIQDQLGQGLYNVMDGKFKGIGKSFTDMLKKMAAEAAAANLAKAMFGSGSGGGGGFWGSLITGGAALYANATGTGLDGFLSANNNFAGRADGGPTSPGGMYEINERGMPEVLEFDGKQFLMMGRKGGSVIPAVAGGGSAGGGMGNMTINNNAPVQLTGARMEQTPRGPVLTLDGIAAEYDNPNSKLSKAQERAYKLQRNR